jgi:hypothetical protein
MLYVLKSAQISGKDLRLSAGKKITAYSKSHATVYSPINATVHTKKLITHNS